MREFTSFDPSVGSGKLVTNGVNKNEQLMIYNDSIYRLRFHFNDGSIGIVPALWNKDYIITNVPLGDIKWETIDQLNIANNPSLLVYGEVYEPGEHVASVNASMQRSVVSSIPGGVTSSVVSLESTGANTSPDGTNIITITDSLGNTFVLDNNGILTLSTKVGAALIQLLKTGIVDPLLTIGANTHTVENLGNEQIDGTLTVNGSVKTNTFRDNSSGTDLIDLAPTSITVNKKILGLSSQSLDIDIASASNFVRLLNNGVDILDATNTGPRLGTGMSYRFQTGTMSRQNGAGATACGAGTTITHGLGATPSLVLATPNIAQTGSATVGIGNVGATTFQATVGAGSLISWWCLAG